MNARQKLEECAAVAIEQLCSMSKERGQNDLGAVAAASELLRQASAAGIFAKAEAPKGNDVAGAPGAAAFDREAYLAIWKDPDLKIDSVTTHKGASAWLGGVDLSAEGKAYANPKPNERMDAAAEAAKSMGAAREEMMQFVVKDEATGPLSPPTRPWRPIAELPKEPDAHKVFAIVGFDHRLVAWDDYVNRWRDYDWTATDRDIRRDYAHFLELTPP